MKDDIVLPNSLERSYLDVEVRLGILGRPSWKRRWVILDHDHQLYFFKNSSQKTHISKFDLSAAFDVLLEEHASSKGGKTTKTFLWCFKPSSTSAAPTPREISQSNFLRLSTDSLRVSQRWFKTFSKMSNLHVENLPLEKSFSDTVLIQAPSVSI